MDLDDARRFVQDHHRAVLVTHRRDGRPQTSPVVAAVDDGGRVIISTREAARKTKNLQRDPRAALCVMTDAFFGPWVHLDGEVEILHRPAAVEVLVDYYRQVSGEHPDWDDYRASLESERRVALCFTITSAGPDASG